MSLLHFVPRLGMARTAAATALVVLLSAVGVTAAAAPAAAASFSDVPASHPYSTHIEWLKARGITSGVGDGTSFAPNSPVTRGQMAVFLHKLGEPYGGTGGLPLTFYAVDAHGNTVTSFSDVTEFAFYWASVEWLAEEGITSGVGSGARFDPDAAVTRGQMAAFLYKLYGAPWFAAPSSPGFADVPTSHTFYKHISWLASTGITSGVGDGTRFAPDEPVTRGQMAVFLYKFAHNLEPWARVQFSDAISTECAFEYWLYNPNPHADRLTLTVRVRAYGEYYYAGNSGPLTAAHGLVRASDGPYPGQPFLYLEPWDPTHGGLQSGAVRIDNRDLMTVLGSVTYCSR